MPADGLPPVRRGDRGGTVTKPRWTKPNSASLSAERVVGRPGDLRLVAARRPASSRRGRAPNLAVNSTLSPACRSKAAFQAWRSMDGGASAVDTAGRPSVDAGCVRVVEVSRC